MKLANALLLLDVAPIVGKKKTYAWLVKNCEKSVLVDAARHPSFSLNNLELNDFTLLNNN